MGVHGLWQLLQPSGRPVSLESLEGKVLAVDVSIWLHQTMKGMRDKDGNPLPNAHLQGLFSRVCKLLFYRIKPVFVFDGGVPVLKKQTMAARRERKAEAERESTDIAQKLLQNLIKSQAVKQAIGSTGGPPTRVPGVRKRKGQQDSDMFELQPLPETEEVDLTLNASEWDRDFEMQENWIREGLAALSDTNPDSEEFKSLPMEIQHEILNELREQRKYHSLSRLTKMPEDSDDFSSYQLKKLMKQSRLSTRIDKVRKEMLNKTAEDITYSMGDDYYGDEVEARRIVSEDASHYVLIKGMTKRKQEEEAEKYELQKRVKLEKEEEDDSEYGGGNQSEGKSENTSPSANEKEQSSNVYSDSDSDVETVMSRRFRKKKYERRWNAEGVAMKLREGKNKSSTGGKQVSSKNAAACQKEAEVVRAAKPSPIDESSSEDEGFIEVTVDPSAAIEEDDLFPASIFETNVEPNNEEMVDSVLNEEKSGKSEQKSGKVVNGSEVPPKPSNIHAKVNKKERSKETTEDAPAPAISEADDEAAAKRRSVLTDILSQLQRKKQDLTEPLPEVENEEAGMSEPEGEDQVAESDVHVSVSSDQQENEEDFSMSGGFFRDDTSDDDGENLQVKEAVGKESIPSASINDTATDKTSDDNKNFHDQQAGRKESIASPTMKHPGASESREKTDTVSHPGKKYESSEAVNINDMETLSDSDEDLKLAIQLSLQTAESEGVIDTGEQELSSKSGDYKVVNGAENNDDSHHRGSKMPAVSEKASPTVQGKHIVKSKKTAVPQVVSSESEDNENEDEDDGSDFEEVTSAHLSSQTSDVISDDKSLHESIDDVEFLQETMKENAKQNRKNQRNNEISDGNDGSDEEGKAVSVRKDEEKEEGKSSVDEIPQDRLQPEDFEMDEDVATYFHTLNEDDLMDINSELDSERSALLSERGRQTRMATSVTEQINFEAQELLQLFGIPFIVSPMEAEAQCAFLDITDQTQGTITDDSDIWLFGGRRMYKNFFNQNKHVEFFTFDGIHNHFGLGREQLINIALLCGSDYTEGIQGVGPVRALEIMAEFPGEGLQGLYMFRKWWDKAKKQKTFVPESKSRARLKDLMVIPGFPSEAVVDAYLNPTVDDSLEKFSWSLPDLDMLRDFAKHKFGWSKEKTDQSLVPMMKQLNKKESQGRIYAYFQPENFVQASKIKSDRLKKALELVRNPRQATEQSSENIDEDENFVSSGSGNKRAPVKKAKKKKPKKQAEEDVEENDDDGDDISDEEKKVKKKKKVRFASTVVSGIEEKTAESGKKKTGKGGKSGIDEERVTDVGSSSVVNEESKDTEVAEVCGMNENKPVGNIRQSKGEMGEGFMQAMAEKVKQATKKLEEMKGKGRGRGRGEKQNVRGRGRVMISLDQKQKPRKGQRSTIKRGGGGPRGRGAVNLSESSSDSGDDEDDAPDYKGETGDGAVKSKNVRQQSLQLKEDTPSKLIVSKSKPPKSIMQKKPETSKPEQKKPVKTSANSSGASHTKNADPLGEDEGLRRKQSTVDRESQAAKDPKEIKVAKSRAECMQDADGNSEKITEQVSPDEHLVDKSVRNNPHRETKNSTKKNHESVKEKTQMQPKEAGKLKPRPRAVSSGQKNVPVEDQSPSIGDKSKSRMRKDESRGELKAETGTRLENNTYLENETQETNASNTEEQTEEIDIRKADVSIINKQNLPATLTYLNQRSREDKFLLHQLTGRKMQNAVEKRLEESERRSKLETKEATKPTVTKPVEENSSFEDMLGGMDAVVTEKVQKKSKKAQAERRKSADSEDSRAASDQALALRNRIAKQIGQVNTVLAGAETKDRSNKKSRERDTRVRTGDDEAGSEQPVTYGKVGEKVKLPKGGTVSFKSAETPQKDEEKVGFGSSDENMDWIDSGPVTKKNSQPSKEKDSLKSRRSAAFDKPIGSDDYNDSKSAKKSKFQKQLEHLDDGRSVKGLGYVPYQSGSTGSAVRGRAFAGKGKGRGKNRNRGEDTGSNEWVKTMQPNAPDIRASRDVTEDEIMEYADMNADDLGSDFSDFEM